MLSGTSCFSKQLVFFLVIAKENLADADNHLPDYSCFLPANNEHK